MLMHGSCTIRGAVKIIEDRHYVLFYAYVYVRSSVEERLCRTLELIITNQSINQSNASIDIVHGA